VGAQTIFDKSGRGLGHKSESPTGYINPRSTYFYLQWKPPDKTQEMVV